MMVRFACSRLVVAAMILCARGEEAEDSYQSGWHYPFDDETGVNLIKSHKNVTWVNSAWEINTDGADFKYGPDGCSKAIVVRADESYRDDRWNGPQNEVNYTNEANVKSLHHTTPHHDSSWTMSFHVKVKDIDRRDAFVSRGGCEDWNEEEDSSSNKLSCPPPTNEEKDESTSHHTNICTPGSVSVGMQKSKDDNNKDDWYPSLDIDRFKENGGRFTFDSATALKKDRWYFIVVTYGGGRDLKLYVDPITDPGSDSELKPAIDLSTHSKNFYFSELDILHYNVVLGKMDKTCVADVKSQGEFILDDFRLVAGVLENFTGLHCQNDDECMSDAVWSTCHRMGQNCQDADTFADNSWECVCPPPSSGSVVGGAATCTMPEMECARGCEAAGYDLFYNQAVAKYRIKGNRGSLKLVLLVD